MKHKRYGCAAEVVNGYIYVFGGDKRRSMERYDPSSNLWELVSDMSSIRYGCGSAVLNGKIYAIGGFNGAYLKTVECFDPVKEKWSKVSPLRRVRCFCAAVALHGCIYVSGGVTSLGSEKPVRSVERYDPSTDTWETVVAALQMARSVHAAVLF
eukprot:g20904.t1